VSNLCLQLIKGELMFACGTFSLFLFVFLVGLGCGLLLALASAIVYKN